MTSVAFNANSGYLAAATAGGATYIWSMANDTTVATLPGSSAVHAVAFSENNEYLAVGDIDGATHLYSVSDLAA